MSHTEMLWILVSVLSAILVMRRVWELGFQRGREVGFADYAIMLQKEGMASQTRMLLNSLLGNVGSGPAQPEERAK